MPEIASGGNRRGPEEGRRVYLGGQAGKAGCGRLRRALRARLDEVGLHDVALRLEAMLDNGTLDGSYDTFSKLIAIAFENSGGETAQRRTLNHKIVHALRDLGCSTARSGRRWARGVPGDLGQSPSRAKYPVPG
jgi:hypothetical protein